MLREIETISRPLQSKDRRQWSAGWYDCPGDRYDRQQIRVELYERREKCGRAGWKAACYLAVYLNDRPQWMRRWVGKHWQQARAAYKDMAANVKPERPPERPCQNVIKFAENLPVRRLPKKPVDTSRKIS